MTIENQNLIGSLPSDLRTLIDEASLLEIVLESVADVGAVGRKAFNSASVRPESSAPMMLTLLTYSYAAGIFGSRDIEAAIYQDRTLRYICAHKYPTWHDIRRFRRLHREWVQKILGATLTEVSVQYLFPFYPETAGNPPRSDFDAQVAMAVAGRLEAAIIMDGVEMDV